MKILLTGGTGFIGTRLVKRLRDEGHSIVLLSRSVGSDAGGIYWDVLSGPPPDEAFYGVDAVIHLAGEAVSGMRWTEESKRKILESREQGTRHLMEGLARNPGAKVVVSSSAIGYYGDRGDEWLTEASGPGVGFLADVCKRWESENIGRRLPGVRRVAIRTGVVLGSGGGMLEKVIPLFKRGLGGRLGSGKQWMSWIHIDDLVEAFLAVIMDDALEGPINGVSPAPATNAEFTRALGHVLGRPTFVCVPAVVLRLLMGEMAGMVLSGQRAKPEKLLGRGFCFRFGRIEDALRDVVAQGITGRQRA